mgnify:CR=1 FL=1|tara:strand:+ start:5676 stop:8252 length:2577 start_codon:yes stop_codon:yes gene_type:complete
MMQRVLFFALFPAIISATEFSAEIRPFLKQHCYKCHGAEKQKADLRLDTLTDDFSDSRTAAAWIEVRDNLNLGEMPPDDEPRPDGDQLIAVSHWIANELRAMQARSNSTDGRVLLRRLSRTEYVNTVRDLLKIRVIEGDGTRELLPPDGKLEGFDKVSKALLLDPSLMDSYFAAGRQIADRAVRIRPPRVEHLAQRYEFETIPNTGGINYLADSRAVDILEDGILLYSGGARTANLPKHPYNDQQVPILGEYTVRVRAGADRGEKGEPVYVELMRGRGLSKRIEVEAPLDAPEIYEWTVTIDPMENMEWQVHIIPGNQFQLYNSRPDQLRREAERLVQSGDPKEGFRLRAQGEAEGGFADRPNPEAYDKTRVPRLFLDYFEIEGPLNESFPPASTRYLYPNGFEDPGKLTIDDARSLFQQLLPRAFRRPVQEDELAAWTELVAQEMELGHSYHDALKTGITAMVCSPDFLFLMEPDSIAVTPPQKPRGFFSRIFGSSTKAEPEPSNGRNLNDFELATRLSYFVWSSMPDGELFDLAAKGELSNPANLDAQVTRMLADPKAEALINDFATQWLKIDEFEQFKPDESIYRHSYYAPRFAGLTADFEEEARSFFREILARDESVLNFLDSDWIMANEKLAAYYGIDGVEGEEFRRVSLPTNSPRGGILGMGGFHQWGSDGARTKPVERGKYILSVLFNDPPDPPPPNAGEVEPNIQGERLTVRERLLQHQEIEACAGCHRTIDPYGLAMENFNVVGLWRDRQDGEIEHFWSHNPPPIINEGALPNGKDYAGFSEFKALLAEQSARFERGLAEKLMIYALGRSLDPADDATLSALVADMSENGHTLSGLIRGIVKTEAFRTK